MWQSQVENEHYSTVGIYRLIQWVIPRMLYRNHSRFSVSLYEWLNYMHSKFQCHSYWQSLVIAVWISIPSPTLMFVFYLWLPHIYILYLLVRYLSPGLQVEGKVVYVCPIQSHFKLQNMHCKNRSVLSTLTCPNTHTKCFGVCIGTNQCA